MTTFFDLQTRADEHGHFEEFTACSRCFDPNTCTLNLNLCTCEECEAELHERELFLCDNLTFLD